MNELKKAKTQLAELSSLAARAKGQEDSHKLGIKLENACEGSKFFFTKTIESIKAVTQDPESEKDQHELDMHFSYFLWHQNQLQIVAKEVKRKISLRNGLFDALKSRKNEHKKQFQEKAQFVEYCKNLLKTAPNSPIKSTATRRLDALLSFFARNRDIMIEMETRDIEGQLRSLGFDAHISNPSMKLISPAELEVEEERWINVVKDTMLQVEKTVRSR